MRRNALWQKSTNDKVQDLNLFERANRQTWGPQHANTLLQHADQTISSLKLIARKIELRESIDLRIIELNDGHLNEKKFRGFPNPYLTCAQADG